MKNIVKLFLWFLLAILNIALFWAGVFLFQNEYYELSIVLFSLLVLIDFFIINPKGYPYRYTIPALVLLFVLVLYPIYFTFKVAFTNYGTGHFMSRQEAIERLLYDPNFSYVVDSTPVSYKVFVVYDGLSPTDDFLILFKTGDTIFLGERPKPVVARGQEVLLSQFNLVPITGETISLNSDTFRIVPWPADLSEINLVVRGEKTYKSFYSPDDEILRLNAPYFKSRIAQGYLVNAEYVLPDGKKLALRIAPDGEWRFMYVERLYRLAYKEIYDGVKMKIKTTVVNNLTGREVVEREGAFYDVDENGNETFLVGFIDFVGWKNFLRIVKDPKVSGPFFRIFLWTFVWAVLSVVLSLAVGLPFALVLNNPRLKGRNLYRTLLIIPWAIPVFISALVWRNGLLNESYGVINKFLLPLFGLEPIKWFNDPFWARVGVLLVNVWLTFPYMMTISLGALQSIPPELYEVAAIDGAGRFRRFLHITFPLLMTIVAPLLVSSFAFSFNNFTIIYLITGGGPPIPNSTTPTGYTDILISYVYKLAFEGGQGQDFGFASAISILIFFLVGGISFVNFKLSGAFEEVSR
ncbi:MAG TPA: DUF4896 domain-containing protein [Thermotoga sp.]|uniref:DUF4896 domain-containing protein n=1 Tax=Thermotoga sp. (strain RQ2) TaxID=126740 RepID=UPI0001600B46|nr:DUF4896 domain-containing protein [Thermotoga sp. RQ2]ACB09951.1 binding-protein-dependent transport systems inner membrane component [Thermotoga sp. RQ2]HBF69955.1 DUF4896 domain-containing protein [Thermotoga sp.]